MRTLLSLKTKFLAISAISKNTGTKMKKFQEKTGNRRLEETIGIRRGQQKEETVDMIVLTRVIILMMKSLANTTGIVWMVKSKSTKRNSLKTLIKIVVVRIERGKGEELSLEKTSTSTLMPIDIMRMMMSPASTIETA